MKHITCAASLLTPSACSRAALLMHAPLTLLRALRWLAAQPCRRGALVDGACCTVLCLGTGFPDVSLSVTIDTQAGRASVRSCIFWGSWRTLKAVLKPSGWCCSSNLPHCNYFLNGDEIQCRTGPRTVAQELHVVKELSPAFTSLVPTAIQRTLPLDSAVALYCGARVSEYMFADCGYT